LNNFNNSVEYENQECLIFESKSKSNMSSEMQFLSIETALEPLAWGAGPKSRSGSVADGNVS
jgi:hypothetical protein